MRVPIGLIEDCEKRMVTEHTDWTTLIVSYLRRYAAGVGRPRVEKGAIGNKEILLTNIIKPRVKQEKKLQEKKLQEKKLQEKKLQEKKISSSPILSAGLDLAQTLAIAIRQNNSQARITEAQMQNWAKEADLMMARDNRSEQEIRRLIAWSQADGFWKSNILSMGKLRKQFDMLYMKSRSKAGESKDEQRRKRNAEVIEAAFAE